MANRSHTSCEMSTAPDGRELRPHGSTAFPAAFFEIPIESMHIIPHWHDDFELLVMRRGTCTVYVGTAPYTVRAGEAFFVNSGTLHSMSGTIPGSTGVFRSVVFSPRLVAGGLESIYWEKYIEPLMQNESMRAVHFNGTAPWHQDAVCDFAAAWDAFQSDDPGFEFVVRERLSHVIAQISANLFARPARRSEQKMRSEARVKTMMQFVHSNYGRRISLADICSHAAVSQSEGLRCFRTTIGTTPMQYVKEYRLNKAAAFLTDTDLSAAEIAERCGFSDQGYFSKSFRAWSGVSPSEYRKKSRSEALSSSTLGDALHATPEATCRACP